jgi:carboxymethylenebutenolidase
MCDELTTSDLAALRSQTSLSRRGFAMAGSAAAITACSGGPSEARGNSRLRERLVTIPTAEGTMDAFFVHPARGRHPAVLLWPDIAGLRDAYKTMARRLAEAGYAVLAVNQYYRSSPAPILTAMAEWRTPEGQARLAPMIARINPQAIVSDARAAVAFLDVQRAVDPARGIGSSGYCMGGPFAVRSAWAVPGRVKAAASFHGAGLVSPAEDSPHRLLAATQASFLFAIAQNDDARPPGDKDALRDAAQAAGRPAETEVYPADHGWCTIDAPVYNHEQAERAWTRMLALFAGL